jgi:DNA polymerase
MNAREQILTEMGFALWRLRDAPAAPGTAAALAAPSPKDAGQPAKATAGAAPALLLHPPAPQPQKTAEAIRPAASASPPAGSALPLPAAPLLPAADALPPAKAQALPPAPEGLSPRIARQQAIAQMDWPELEEAIRSCRDCPLCRHRKQAVPGIGGKHPDWLFIGEAPGAEEDAKGEPFVGQAGKLLDAMLAAIGIGRHDKAYIANGAKCRPEGNRTPTPEELSACRPFIARQIALLQPKIIVLLGKAAAVSVLQSDKALGAMRLQRFHCGIAGDTPVVVTYHPAYLLRNLPDKAKAWEDLCFARHILEGRT